MNSIKVSFAHNRSAFASRNMEYLRSELAEKHYFIKESQLKSFVSFVGTERGIFCPATFKVDFFTVEMSRNTFEQVQLFVLEFDNVDCLDAILSRANRYQYAVLFAYLFLNDRGEQGFRVVFLNDVPIEYPEVAEIMMDALLAVFPEASKKSRDFTEVYTGGKKLLYIAPTVGTINIELIFRNMHLYWKEQHGDKHYRRKVLEFSRATGVALNAKKYLDVSIKGESSSSDNNGTFLPNSIIYKISIGNKSPFSDTSEFSCSSKLWYQLVMADSQSQQSSNTVASSDTTQYHREFRASDIEYFSRGCRLLREFETGVRMLTSTELLGISTSLASIDKGADLFLKSIQKYSYFDSDPRQYSDWKFYLNYWKKTNCVKLPCDQFCPYEHQCHHLDSLATKIKYHEVKVQANYKEELYPVDVVAAELKSKFDEAMSTSLDGLGKYVTAINAPTGTGKSTMVLDYMKEHPEKKIMYACPTIDLKDSTFEAALDRGIKAVKTPSLIEYKDELPTHVWNNIQGLYQVGKYRAVAEYVREIVAKKDVPPKSLDVLKKYLEDVRAFYRFDGNVFTTHSMLSAMDYLTLKTRDAVIIDEDPLLNHMVANQIEIPVSKLERVLAEVDAESGLAKKIRDALAAAETDPWITLISIPYDTTYSTISVDVDIPSFCAASKFYFNRELDHKNGKDEERFVFFKPFGLNPRIKYVILSATINPRIYNFVFGASRVDYHECHKVKYAGKLQQYTYYSGSHAFVSEHPEIVKEMVKLGGTDTVITFKGGAFAMEDCYFGKTTGIDRYKNVERLTVLGTFHRPEWLYKLFVFTVGHANFEVYKDAKLCPRDLFINGKGVKFMTYDKSADLLREVQLWMIESEQEQAVGRARLSRFENTVTVFSNFPLSQAKLIETDYAKGVNKETTKK